MVPDGFTGVIEPDGVYRKGNRLLIARTAGTVESGLTLVCIVNVSEAAIDLHEKTPVGLFRLAVDQYDEISRVGIYELVQTNNNVLNLLHLCGHKGSTLICQTQC